MIHLKENPVGIDYEIQRIQQYLYKNLKLWNIEAFGRVEMLDNDLLIFKKGIDYEKALGLNDSSNGRFFFLDSNLTTEKSKQLTTDIELIHRADEEVKMEILNFLKKKVPGSIEILKGQDVLKSFETKLLDMQPYHFIKLSFEHKYNNNIITF